MEYRTILREGNSVLIEKRSRFLAAARPATSEEEALAFLAEQRSRYRDASHNVYAYSLRNNHLARFSDDGEPQGTAGTPVMELLQKEEVTDLIVVITRYFGGTLLGAGGLVRAYTTAAKQALDAAGIVRMRRCLLFRLSVPYPLFTSVQNAAAKFEGRVEEIDYGENISFLCLVPEEGGEQFCRTVTDLSAGAIVPHAEDEKFCP